MRGHDKPTPPGWPEVTFHASPARTLGLAALSLILALMSAGTLLLVPPWSLKWVMSWAGLILFTWFGVRWLQEGLTRGPLVSVGAKGVRDVRISSEWIPWTAIRGIGRYFSSVVLRVDAASVASIPLTRLGRWMRWSNALFPAYNISTANLKGGYAALKRALDDGLNRSRGG